jgi:hypothetical protein
MYSGVPSSVPTRVNMVSAVNFWLSALGTPKSITFGPGRPSTSVTRMLEGFRSRDQGLSEVNGSGLLAAWVLPVVSGAQQPWQPDNNIRRRGSLADQSRNIH